MAGSVRVVVPGDNQLPAAPADLRPGGGTANVSISPTLTAGAFYDPDQDDAHGASQWIIRDVARGQVVFDSQESTMLTSITITGLEHSTTYAWKVRYRDDLGGWSEYSAETQFTTVAAPVGAGAGLTASYGSYAWKTNKFTLRTTQTDAIVNFDWKLARPNRLVSADNFAVYWEGKVLPDYSERYRFRVRADGGVRLWVNGVLLIDDWLVTPFTVFRSGVIPLEAGVSATIKLHYFDAAGKASVALSWSSLSQPVEIIPQAKLFPLVP
jgi:hypothetical protein